MAAAVIGAAVRVRRAAPPMSTPPALTVLAGDLRPLVGAANPAGFP
jgi:hypothetical protein